ncbi:MAG: response regulator transcription factor [Verrucomicrobia bacterium]|nr:response regulator transcription factor [Verrucomicrobiota bacterium]
MRVFDHSFASNLPTLTVWLVDDNEAIRELLPQLLDEQLRLRVTRTFATATQALAAAQEGTAADAILLDVHLGGESGLDYIRPLHQYAPESRIIMFTTFMNTEEESRAFSEGASGYLLKSARVERIARTIHESRVAERRAACVETRNEFTRTASGENARLEPAVRGFRHPAGLHFVGIWAGLARLWRGTTAHATRFGMHF